MNCYSFEDIKKGLQESFSITITEDMMKKFRDITGDVNPLHNDIEYAQKEGFKDRICYGMLTASLLSTLAGVYLPGEKSLIYSVNINFTKPVFIGDKLTVTGTVKELNDLFKSLTMKTEIFNQNGVKVLRGNMEVGIKS